MGESEGEKYEENNGLTSWRRFQFQESNKYESSGDTLDVCNRFLIGIGGSRTSNLYIYE